MSKPLKTLQESIEEMQTKGYCFNSFDLQQLLMWFGEMQMLRQKIEKLESERK